MKKIRLSLAIPLPHEIHRELASCMDHLRTLFLAPIRFVKPEHIHITLLFLGYQEIEKIGSIQKTIESLLREGEAPEICFDAITYGPADKNGISRTPRMIWVNCTRETSSVLAQIKNQLEHELFSSHIYFKQETRMFQGHMTLARFPAILKTDLPFISCLFQKSFYANQVDIMESRLFRSGPEYHILKTNLFLK